jgi:large subunit ribosomal protein L6
VRGPKGTLSLACPAGFEVVIESKSVNVMPVGAVKLSGLDKQCSAMYGTLCRNLSNMIVGVSKGFDKKLELVGVGYKADLVNSRVLKLSLGYSHDIMYSIPETISVVMEKPTLFSLTGACKQKVGQAASEIIRFRPPEPYKGKGVRVPGQYLRMKEGKSK